MVILLRATRFSPRFFGRIKRAGISVGNPSEKLRIGTLPIEESLAYKSYGMHTVSPSEIYTALSRTGARARAVHKANEVRECACLPYALRGGWLSAFTPPSILLGTGEAQKRSTKRPEAAEKQPGQSPADPAEAGSTPKKKNQRSPTRLGSPRSSKSGKKPSQPAGTPVQADAGALPKRSTGRP